MWTLELTVKHVQKIVKMHALRNSQIVFSRGRGLILQGFQHLHKLAKNAFKVEADMSPKSRKRSPKAFEKVT